MPVTLQPTSLKYKNSNDVFQSATAIKGDDGYSPTIAITDITGGHRITITDADGPHSFDVMNGDSVVQDVQVNDTSVLNNGIAVIPKAELNGTTSTYGVVKLLPGGGLSFSSDALCTNPATSVAIQKGSGYFNSITPYTQHLATFYGLAKVAGDTTQSSSDNAVGTYTDSAKSAISTMLNSPVTVSGTTPTITALPGVRYICGEVTTLDITLPESGIVDVVFESGSTPTVLTITPPTGVTVKWANGFDPTALEADTTYEINIVDGLGVAGAWS